MELSKKTTLLFPPDMHAQLSRLAEQRRVSFGELVREACAAHYGIVSKEARIAAVRELAAMALPVGDPDQLERESVPTSEDVPA